MPIKKVTVKIIKEVLDCDCGCGRRDIPIDQRVKCNGCNRDVTSGCVSLIKLPTQIDILGHTNKNPDLNSDSPIYEYSVCSDCKATISGEFRERYNAERSRYLRALNELFSDLKNNLAKNKTKIC